MDQSRDALLRDYLQRVTALRREMNDTMTLDQVQEVARDLGMDQSDLAAAAQAAADHRERGIRYCRHEQYDDAVRELRDAVALDPFSTDGLYALADALRRRDNRGDEDEALRLAHRVVEIEPKNEGAYDLIRRIREGDKAAHEGHTQVPAMRQWTRDEKKRKLWRNVTLMIVTAVMVGFFSIILVSTKSEVKVPEEATGEPSSSGITVRPDPSNPNSKEPAISIRETPPSEENTRTPLTFAWRGKHEGFEMEMTLLERVVATEMIVGVTDGFETSHQLTLEVKNNGTKPITQLALNFVDFDANGKRLGEHSVEAIHAGDLPLDPSATRKLDLKYPTKSTLNKFKVEVAEVH